VTFIKVRVGPLSFSHQWIDFKGPRPEPALALVARDGVQGQSPWRVRRAEPSRFLTSGGRHATSPFVIF
jgi:hypothetical protein